MKPAPKCDDSETIAPPARCARVPPVAGSASGLTRVGSCELQRPSNRTISVCASARFQSIRRSATLLSVARSPGSAGTVMGTPVAPASARKRAAESGLTPSRSRLGASADTSDGRAWPRQRPCSDPNTNSRLGTIGPPMPPPSWFWVYPWSKGDSVPPPQARPRSRSAYVTDPGGPLVPRRGVEARRPPENWPRATSKVPAPTGVGHEAILICLTRDRDPRRGQAQVAHDELVLAAAVREEDGEASARVRGALTRHLGFERRRLDGRSGQRLVVGAGDSTGDDIGRGADLSRDGRRAERGESDQQPAGRAWHHGAGSGEVHEVYEGGRKPVELLRLWRARRGGVHAPEIAGTTTTPVDADNHV